jgi:transposase
MNLHANAALSWTGRRRLCELVVDDGWTVAAAAASAGVSVRCARKWVGRYTAAGEAGLVDRSSAPKRVANRRAPDRVEAIAKLRRLRFTAAEIAETLGMALSTVSGILTRIGMGKLGRLGLEQPIRYERSRPGELVHIDIKKLARIKGGAGWRVRGGAQHYNSTFHDLAGRRRRTVGYEYVHVAVDDYSRLAYAEVLPDEKASSAISFLRRATAFYRRHGVEVERILTDNGSAYRAVMHAVACRQLAIRHIPAPGPTDRRQTGKPNASSAPCSTAGPTGPSTDQAKNAHAPLTEGYGTTTIDDDTQHSATNPRSAEPTCSGPTPSALEATRSSAKPPSRRAMMGRRLETLGQ